MTRPLQLYALALYISSLEAPSKPNPFNEQARRGQAVFSEQGCINCHTPPFFTSNKITPLWDSKCRPILEPATTSWTRAWGPIRTWP